MRNFHNGSTVFQTMTYSAVADCATRHALKTDIAKGAASRAQKAFDIMNDASFIANVFVITMASVAGAYMGLAF